MSTDTLTVPARAQMLKKLQKHTVKITFIKQSTGKRDVMRATLHPDTVPYSEMLPENNNREVMTVWNVDKQAWRSIRVDSVKKFEQV